MIGDVDIRQFTLAKIQRENEDYRTERYMALLNQISAS